jgi:branched-subunit amino acid transport protein
MASTWDVSTSVHEAVSMQVLFTVFRRHVNCSWDLQWAVAFLRLPVTGLFPRRPEVITRPVYVGSVMDEMALGQLFNRVLRFAAVSIISPLLHSYFFVTELFVIYLFTAVGLTAGCSNTLHIYTHTIHRTTQ